MNHSADLADVMARVLGGAPATDVRTLPALWSTLVDLGWDAVGVEEELGGQGGGLADVLETARGAGRFVPLLPLVENAVARHAVAWAGLVWPFPGRPGVLVMPGAAGPGASFAGGSGHRWLVPGTVAVVVSRAAGGHGPTGRRSAISFVTVEKHHHSPHRQAMSGEPVGSLIDLAGVGGPPDEALSETSAVDVDEILARANDLSSLLRAAAIQGAVERVCSATTEHVRTREQFGRPLVALPAVMQAVATMAAERDLLGAAVTWARTTGRHADSRGAAALSVAARSGTEVARLAHQMHGAIGITQENSLHLWTRRIWDWRDTDSGSRAAAARVGRRVVEDGEEGLWRLVTGAST